MRKSSKQSNRAKVLHREKQGYLPVIAVVLVVLALLSSCATPVTEPPVDGTEFPPTEPSSEVTEAPASEIPDGATKCEGDAGTYTCSGLSDHEISLAGVPDNVLPYSLAVSPDREEQLRQEDKEGTECIFAIVGDLAFYDTDNKLVTDFSKTPVTITYSFNEEDLAEFEVCRQSILAEAVEYVPVFFSDTWKPFPEGTFSVDGNVVAITATSWGDQPVGGGTKP